MNEESILIDVKIALRHLAHVNQCGHILMAISALKRIETNIQSSPLIKREWTAEEILRQEG